MKKVINIALGGIVFAIEDDAHVLLREYLGRVERAMHNNDDYPEIAADIESAIAEKFIKAKKNERRAVTNEDVERVIAELGEVSDFTEGAVGSDEETGKDVGASRRLFRNTDDAVIGGVASGIAAYFDIDPVIVRVIFVISIFLNGLGILIYILLWIIVPPATTAADKYAMRGERVTITHIVDRVKKKLNDDESAQKGKPRGISGALKDVLGVIFAILGDIVRLLLVVLRYLFGVILIIVGALLVAALAFGIMAAISGSAFVPLNPDTLRPLETLFSDSSIGLIFLVSAALAIAVPAVFSIMGGMSLLQKKNAFTAGSTVTLFIIFVVAVTIVAALAIRYLPPLIAEYRNGRQDSGNSGEIACTLEAKMCPDGSFVGRVGPNCEFAECPTPEIPEDLQEQIDAKADLIIVDAPEPFAQVSSPVTVRGEARGNWYFEASFPITIVDWDGRIIGEGFATAQDEWMTTEFVPFEGTITFDLPEDTPYRRGAIIFKKDNPSGLPENDDALEIPVTF